MPNRACITTQKEEPPPATFCRDTLDKVQDFVVCAMQKIGFTNSEVSILFCDNDYIRQLNSTYRKKDCATDILSFEDGFDYREANILWHNLGDIAISTQMLKENALYFDTDENTELKRLLLHGLLHLKGLDHKAEHIIKGKKPKCQMLLLQETLLNGFMEYKIL